MNKTIKIDGKSCEFKTSAAIPRLYRVKFNRDIFSDMIKINKQVKIQEQLKKEAKEDCEKRGIPFNEEEFESELPIDVLEIFEKVAFLMARHADPSQPDDIDEWLAQFDTFSIYKVLPEIAALWGDGNKQLSKPKKESGK